MINRTFPCSKDAFLNQPNRGNGGGDYLVVGPVAGNRNRIVLQLDANWTGGITVAEALLDLTVAGGCFTQGPNVAAHFKRIPKGTSFLEGNQGKNDNCGAFTDNAITYDETPTSVATHQVDWNPGAQPSPGDVVTIDLTDIVQDCFNGGVDPDGSVRLLVIAGTVASANEDNANNTVVFWSHEGSKDKAPRLRVRLTDNRAPNAPTVTIPVTVEGSSPPNIASYSGRAVPVTWQQNDPDDGDYTAARQHQFYASTATDGTPGTPLIDRTIASDGRPTRGTDAVAGLPTRTQLRERSRTRDQKGAWGAWTPLADHLIKTAFVPRQPSNPYFQKNSTTPVIAGSINSADPNDYATGYEPEVYKDRVAGGSIAMWAPGRQDIGGSPTRAQLTYAGLDIQPGDKLRWRHRIYNRDNVPGDWSPYYNVTVVASTGPSAMSPTDSSTKQLSRTATLTIADAANFDRYRWLLFRAGAQIYDSGVVTVGSTNSVGVAIPSGYANWGDDELTWQAQIRHTGNSAIEALSPQYPFYINSLPSTELSVAA